LKEETKPPFPLSVLRSPHSVYTSTLKKEAEGSYETVAIYQIVCRHPGEDGNPKMVTLPRVEAQRHVGATLRELLMATVYGGK
jgi:hypothetical protein